MPYASEFSFIDNFLLTLIYVLSCPVKKGRGGGEHKMEKCFVCGAIQSSENHLSFHRDQSNHLTLDEKFDDLDLECFRGDIEKAKQCWNIVETTITKNKKRLRSLQQTNRRLRSNLYKWTNIWKQVENENMEVCTISTRHYVTSHTTTMAPRTT
ncbi:unnamed protein product [Callosobruchus maculatus]|uniref:Uncharacterized protein n=1 Tax=Callosobruchus maculatus TaxID=64391 RepID=A0A653D811_CALMS|nr:unnamed protein product [Callosobruchus maculatus]